MVYYENIKLDKGLMIARTFSKFEPHGIHVHELLELCVLIKNEARYRFNDIDYFGKPGDVFLCRPFEAHWIFSKDEHAPCETILMLFSPSMTRNIPNGDSLLLPFYVNNGLPAKIPGESLFAVKIHHALIQALNVMEGREPFWEVKQFMYFLDILIQLNAYGLEEQATIGHEPANQSIIHSISYIISHVNEEKNIDQAIEISSLGKTMFYRKFRQLTGTSPNAFINRMRLQIAAYEIAYTSQTITDIALNSGFGSLSTFNKQFKAYYNRSPREYRKEH